MEHDVLPWDFPFLQDLWGRTAHGPPVQRSAPPPALPELRAHNDRMGAEFRQLRDNRLLVGAYRYGITGAPGKPKYDRVSMILKRLQAYKDGGNLEHLVDIANLAELEFIEGDHPLRHFHSQDQGIDQGKATERSGYV